MTMTDQPDTRPVWANKGEAVTCINGHPICEIARQIFVGDGRSGADFCNWQQPEPPKEQSVAEIRCTECRGVWIRGNTQAGYQFHFGVFADPTEGWR